MERRFAWARDIMQQYQQEAMRRLAAQTDTQQTPADEIPVQLFHLSPWPEENAIQTFTLRLPADTLLRGACYPNSRRTGHSLSDRPPAKKTA